jgi:hypothetical protein
VKDVRKLISWLKRDYAKNILAYINL